MDKKNWLQRLQDKWKLKNTVQVVLVLVVFACTGTTILLIKKPLMTLISPEFKDHWFFSALYFIFILPLYNVFLLFYGFVFGQFAFFWEFEKKTFRRIAGRFKK